MSTMNTILFISHEASLTGAPILLLNFIRWFKKNSNTPFIILLRKDGALRRDFEELGKTFIYEDLTKQKNDFKHRIKRRLFSTIKHQPNKLRTEISRFKIGLIFSNTLTNGDILKNLNLDQTKMITYAHELSHVIENFGRVKDNLDIVLNKTNFFLTGSEAVRKNLSQNYGVSDTKSKVVYSYLPTLDFKRKSSEEIEELKKSLNIPADAFVAGGIGRGLWRKGIDLFIYVADHLINKQGEEIYFIWIGIDEGEEFNMVQHDLKLLGLTEKVKFLFSNKNILSYFSLMDVFLLTSREDPYPVVVIEAASMQIPVVCFEGGGGAPEFTANNCGFSVSYLRIEEMADRIKLLKNSEKLYRTITANALQKIHEFHDIEYAGPIIKDCIEKEMMSR